MKWKEVVRWVVSVVITACVCGAMAEEAETPQAQLQKSLDTWQTLKAKCQGNYSYAVLFSSWVGFGHETVIVVKNNKVAERRYREWNNRAPVAPPVPGEAPKPEGVSWTESDKELGSHKAGGALKTLDELYADAKKVLDKKLQPTERLYVAFDKQGLLQHCFYVNTMISDDAPRNGVIIDKLTLEPAK